MRFVSSDMQNFVIKGDINDFYKIIFAISRKIDIDTLIIIGHIINDYRGSKKY